MSRTNVQVLIATALLGVLLVVVLRLSGRLAEQLPDGTEPVAPITERTDTEYQQSASVVSITNHDEFVTALNTMGLDGKLVLSDTARWYQARGFLGAAPLLGIGSDDAPMVYYQSLDDATLTGLADAGDLAAAQVLASRKALQEPLASIDGYETAAGLGSTYALLQLASLYETFEAVGQAGFDERLDLKPARLQPGMLKMRALALVLAALRDGGPPLANERLLAWIDRLAGALPEDQRAQACVLSEKLFLEFSSQRRRHGLPPVRSDPPPAFLTVPGLAQRLPCEQSSSPYRSMLNLNDCETESVWVEHGQPGKLVVCH